MPNSLYVEISAFEEARRQFQICNACRYCEGYCAVFPSMFEQRLHSDGDITQLANLCHDCRGCFYACQYTEPHEFALNVPKALSEVRHMSWQMLAWPRSFARLYDRSGVLVSCVLVATLAFLFYLASAIRPTSGEGFYAIMSHGVMVTIFTPAFVLPLLAVGVSLRRYWVEVGGGLLRFNHVRTALAAVGTMKNLAGGHGEGCNFEEDDRFSNRRRYYHQLTLYGFLMCLASTVSGTIMHYGFGVEAPYSLWSVPKLFGVPGGIMLCIGTLGLAVLKTKADTEPGNSMVWSGEMAFILLLFGVSATGLLLFAATGTKLVAMLLPVHLGFVLTFFLITPYSKMVHGFYRLTALVQNAVRK